MRDRLIELIRKSGCVDTWNYHADDFKEPNPIYELADYLLAKGVIVPPCKIGDTVYSVRKEAKRGHWEEHRYIVDEMSDWEIIKRPFNFVVMGVEKLGKDYFLTREEAEQALKGGEG